jgi:fucose permease
MALMSGAILMASLAGSLVALLAATFLAGFGFGWALAAGNVLVSSLFTKHRATALNGVNVFFGVGAIIGPAIVGLMGSRLGLPQAALWLGGGLMLALVPLVLWFAGSPTLSKPAAEDVAPPRRQMAALLIGLMLLLYTGIEVGFAGWVTVYMAQSTALAISEAALVASGFWLALTSGRMLGAALGMRLTAQTLLMASLIGLLSGVGLLVLSVGSYWPSLAGVLLLGFACGPVFPTSLALITAAAQGGNGAAGLALGLGNSGGLVLPALLGLTLARYGPSAMVGTLLACALVMIVLGTLALRDVGAPPALQKSLYGR